MLSVLQMYYWSVMAALGVCYGAQLANVIAVAHELVGSQDMALAFGFELSMQGLGSLVGGPIAGKIVECTCTLRHFLRGIP